MLAELRRFPNLRIPRTSLGIFVLLASLHLAVPSAKAASNESREREAKKACLAGDVAKGIAILAELYVKTDKMVLLFNQGRCFEQNGRYEEAIVRFREFQQKVKDSGAPPNPIAEEHIAKCKALLVEKRQGDQPVPSPVPAAPASEPVAPAPPAPPAAAPPPAVTPQQEVSTPSAPAPEATTLVASPEPSQKSAAKPGAGLRVAGITVMTMGLAGIATGIALNVKANDIADEIESERPYLRSREDTRSRYETWGWVGYGLGGACLLGGAVLYYFGYSQGHDSQVALLPSVQAGSYGAALQGAF
jgi:hypothetical protein